MTGVPKSLPPLLTFEWLGVRARAAEDALRHRDALASAAELEWLAADAARLAGALRARIAAAPARVHFDERDLAELASALAGNFSLVELLESAPG